jgi:hypothetical protein
MRRDSAGKKKAVSRPLARDAYGLPDLWIDKRPRCLGSIKDQELTWVNSLYPKGKGGRMSADPEHEPEHQQLHEDEALGDKYPRPEHPIIFVNSRRFERGVHWKMTVDELARLVGLTEETSVVRRLDGCHYSQPLSGTVEIKDGDRFSILRKKVEGGHGTSPRVLHELEVLREGGVQADLASEPLAAVIYRALPVLGTNPHGSTDVLVLIPPGYPAVRLDGAALPVGSSLLGRVKGAPQHEFQAAGQTWKMVSYHPHEGGGGPPWNPSEHGFHTYLQEIMSWLGVVQ